MPRRALALALCLVPSALAAQARVTVVVRGDGGEPIPFAVVSVGKSRADVADDSGRVALRGIKGDSLALDVRRIGYRPFTAKIAVADTVTVTLRLLAAQLASVVVTAPGNTPLAERGFYDRVLRVKRGAGTGEFITPEELEQRSNSRLSQVLTGYQYVRVAHTSPRRQPLLLGRGGCGMAIVVDGQLVRGTVQDAVRSEVPTSIDGRGSAQTGTSGAGGALLDIDAIVNGNDVQAVEIYPSMANAPAELIQPSARGSCGLIVIWTGAKR